MKKLDVGRGRFRTRKYSADNLIPMLRLAVNFRNQMVAADFTDNGGAIHSAERILDILGLALKYRKLTHINNLRRMKGAPFSIKALAAHRRGEKVLIEDVAPRRALTQRVIDLIDQGTTNTNLKRFIRSKYSLVLLTPAETAKLNRQNRSRLDPNRLAKAGIVLAARKPKAPGLRK